MKNNLSKALQILNVIVILGAAVGFWTNQSVVSAVQSEDIKNINQRLDGFISDVTMRFDKSDQKIDALYEIRNKQ